MENRRSVAKKLQNVYLHMVDKQQQPTYFQGHLAHLAPKLHGGNVRQEKRALPSLNIEPPTLYVGSPVINYPKALMQDVRRKPSKKYKDVSSDEGDSSSDEEQEGGKIDFGRIARGAKNIYDKIPEPIKAKAKELIIKKAKEALAGAGRKPRALAGGVNRLKKSKRWLGFVANDLIPSGIKSAESVYASAKKMGGKVKKPNARAAIVKKVMKQHGLSLPQAFSFVKAHGLY